MGSARVPESHFWVTGEIVFCSKEIPLRGSGAISAKNIDQGVVVALPMVTTPTQPIMFELENAPLPHRCKGFVWKRFPYHTIVNVLVLADSLAEQARCLV